MMDEIICKQCNGTTNQTDNRLVKDACGHLKCRQCLVKDIDGCSSCVNGVSYDIADDDNLSSKDNTSKTDRKKRRKKKTVTVNEVQKKVNKKNKATQGENWKKRRKYTWPKNVLVEMGSNGNTYYCTVCKKRFKAKTHVNYHAYCDGSSKPHICPYCDKGFASRSHFDYHLRVHRGYRPYVCDTCQAGFYQKSKLNRHLLCHTGEKKFSCSICNASFNNAVSLKRHTFIHSGQKPHTCKICSKQFRDVSNLKKHEEKHKGTQETGCPECGKVFTERRGRELHARIHAKPSIACLICSRVFHTHKDMRRHAAVHTDNKPYRCTQCQVRFRRKDNLDRHLRNAHPGVNAAESFEIVEEPPNDNKLEKLQTSSDSEVQDLSMEKSKLESRNPLPPLPLEKLETKFSNHFIIEENNKRETVIFGPIKINPTISESPKTEVNNETSAVSYDYNETSYLRYKKKINPIDLYRQILVTGKKHSEATVTKNDDDSKCEPVYIHKKVNYELKTDLFKNKKAADNYLPPITLEKIQIMQKNSSEKDHASVSTPINMELYKKILIPDYNSSKISDTDSDKSNSTQKEDNNAHNVSGNDIHWRRRMAMNSNQ